MPDLTVYKVIICRHIISLTSLTKQMVPLNMFTQSQHSPFFYLIIYLFIYIQIDPKRFENLLDIEQVLMS